MEVKNHSIKKHIANWPFIRILRLGLGISMIIGAFDKVDYFVGGIGLLLLVQAITNTGCAGGSCNIDTRK